MSDPRRPLFAASCAGMFIFGMVLAVLGTLFGMPQTRERLHLQLVQQGDLLLMLYFGIIVATVIVGPVIDSFGNKVVLLTSAALVTIGLAGFSASHSFLVAMAWTCILGAGGGGLNTASNAFVSDLYADDRGPMLNLLGVFFGFGALFMPLVAASIMDRVTIPQLLLTAATLAALCTIAYIALPFPPPRATSGFSIFGSLKVVTYPGVLLFGILLLIEAGNEAAIGGWTSTYVGSIGGPPRSATWILAAYWGGLMAGRAVGAKLLARISKERLVMASGASSAIGCTVLIASPSLVVMGVGAAIVGASFAAIYPTTLAIAADRYQNLAGTIFGLLFAIGLLGGMTFPWAVGHISDAFGLRAGMLLPLAGGIAIAILAAMIGLRKLQSAT